MMALLTPVLKGHLTDRGFLNAVEAQQVYGGHGYIAEWGMEQFVRDARIAMIYEGANGIQALDLVGRKLASNGGRAVFAFFKEIDGFVADNEGNAKLKNYLEPLKLARKRLEEATMWFMENALENPDNAGAGSTPYMHLFGVTGIAFMWAMMAKVALDKLADGAGDEAEYYEAKLRTGLFYMQQAVPETAMQLERVRAGASSMMSMAANDF